MEHSMEHGVDPALSSGLFQWLTDYMAERGYMPHGYCIQWDNFLTPVMVISDLITFLAYFSLPIALLYFAKRRTDFPFPKILWLFAIFILACGMTHLMDVITLWIPFYDASAFFKAVTAIASLATAVAIWPLIPAALKIPSQTVLKKINVDLVLEIAEKERIQIDLYAANKRAEEAKEAADAANLSKSTFLANMSHEIRTPMNGILGMANILRRDGLTPQQMERLDKIDSAAQHLLHIINDILDISKIEAGKFGIEETSVSISSILTNVSSILSERAKAKGISLVVEPIYLPPNLYGDPTRLQQALLNYATNAIKFTERGSVTLRTLKLEETLESVLVRFDVVDTGIGIPSETLTRLFSTFEQADNSTSRKYGGTGLGLAITRRLAELMGGEAGVGSSLGIGSTFWFTARLKKGEPEEISQSAMHSDPEKAIRELYQGNRILVVDDDPMNREVAQIQLEATGLIIDIAQDGEEAITMAREFNYVAILMDMQMPNVDGLEATRQIRLLPGYRRTPIIAMTANAFAEDKSRCIDAGMNDFLIKPFDPDTLFSTLLRALSRHDA